MKLIKPLCTSHALKDVGLRIFCDKCGNWIPECTCSIPIVDTPEAHEEDTFAKTVFRRKLLRFINELSEYNVPEVIANDTRFIRGMGLDSLDVVELVMMIEDEYNIIIDDSILERCDTLENAITEMVKLFKEDNPQYLNGLSMGKKHGIKRCRRIYKEGDELKIPGIDKSSFIAGYNAGYREARWDYIKK